MAEAGSEQQVWWDGFTAEDQAEITQAAKEWTINDALAWKLHAHGVLISTWLDGNDHPEAYIPEAFYNFVRGLHGVPAH
jgi:hypothetical protein